MEQLLRGKDCPENPEALKGQPIGMYHCPYCGMMQVAGCKHLNPSDINPDIYCDEGIYCKNCKFDCDLAGTTIILDKRKREGQ